MPTARQRSSGSPVQDPRTLGSIKKTSLLQTHPRTLRSCKRPLTETLGAPGVRARFRCLARPDPPTKPMACAIGCVPSSRCRIPRDPACAGPRNLCSRRCLEPMSHEQPGPSKRARSWRSRRLVEPDGIEPTTSCLQSTRSPS